MSLCDTVSPERPLERRPAPFPVSVCGIPTPAERVPLAVPVSADFRPSKRSHVVVWSPSQCTAPVPGERECPERLKKKRSTPSTGPRRKPASPRVAGHATGAHRLSAPRRPLRSVATTPRRSGCGTRRRSQRRACHHTEDLLQSPPSSQSFWRQPPGQPATTRPLTQRALLETHGPRSPGRQ